MALNPLSEYISGVKSLAFKLFGKKSDNSWEAIKTNDAGAMNVAVTDSIPAGTNNIGDVDIASAIPAGTNVIGKVTIDQTTPGTTNKVVSEITGNTLAEQKTQANAVAGVLTFSANISTIEIYNTDVLNDGVFTVNGIAITVPKGIAYKTTVGGTPGLTVTVTGATSYIVSRYV
jgi:hypothetical protein